MEARIMLRVCQRLDIRTFFLPHGVQDPACIPPLEFDFAYLYGEASLSDYLRAGIASRAVYLVGSPKFDAFLSHANRSPTVKAVGICTNLLTREIETETLLRSLLAEFGDLTFCIRPHPRDKRPFFAEIAENLGLDYSDPKAEGSFDFLQRVDAIVAGDTGIHLEAALMNVCPIYLASLGAGEDLLGFIRKGLVFNAEDQGEVLVYLRNFRNAKPEVRDRARYYVTSVGSEWDGNAAENIANLIRENIRGNIEIGSSDCRPVVISGSYTSQPHHNKSKHPEPKTQQPG
jgi:hypothetical protein